MRVPTPVENVKVFSFSNFNQMPQENPTTQSVALSPPTEAQGKPGSPEFGFSPESVRDSFRSKQGRLRINTQFRVPPPQHLALVTP